jgi:hypothetical protein
MYEELSKLAVTAGGMIAAQQSVATPPCWESFELASGNFQLLSADGCQSRMPWVWRQNFCF